MKQLWLVDAQTVDRHTAQRQDIVQNAQCRNVEVTMAGATDHRVAYPSLADATPLELLIVSVGVHFAMTRLSLLFLAPRAFATPRSGTFG